MSKIYTSYYGNKELDRDKQFLVQISTSKPSYFKVDYDFKLLHPDWKIISDYKAKRITDADYKYKYLKQLYSKKDLIISTLVGIKNSTKKDIILLSQEKPSEFCHRHVFEEWLNSEVENNRNYKWIKIEGEL